MYESYSMTDEQCKVFVISWLALRWNGDDYMKMTQTHDADDDDADADGDQVHSGGGVWGRRREDGGQGGDQGGRGDHGLNIINTMIIISIMVRIMKDQGSWLSSQSWSGSVLQLSVGNP